MMGNTAGHLYSSVFLVMLILGVLVFFANECIVHFIILRIRKKTGKSRDEAYLEFCKGRDERRKQRAELLARGSEPVHITPVKEERRRFLTQDRYISPSPFTEDEASRFQTSFDAEIKRRRDARRCRKLSLELANNIFEYTISEAENRRKSRRCACGRELTSREAAQAMCAICQVNGYQIDCPSCGITIHPGLLLRTGLPIYKKCDKCEVKSC